MLKFAEGDVAFLMRTLDKRKCLTNNTRVQILDVKRRFTDVQLFLATMTAEVKFLAIRQSLHPH